VILTSIWEILSWFLRVVGTYTTWNKVLCSLQKNKKKIPMDAIPPPQLPATFLSCPFFMRMPLADGNSCWSKVWVVLRGRGWATTTTVTNFATLFRRQKQLFLFITLMRFSTAQTVFLVLSYGLGLRTEARSSEITIAAVLWEGGKVTHCN
jgi:hypothetical protein